MCDKGVEGVRGAGLCVGSDTLTAAKKIEIEELGLSQVNSSYIIMPKSYMWLCGGRPCVGKLHVVDTYVIM